MGLHLDLASTRGRLKIFCYVLFTVLFIVQCSTILNQFLEYPFIIDLDDARPGLINDLPGVTICSNNRLSLKKLLKRNPQLRKMVERRFPDYALGKRSQMGPQFNQFRDGIYRIFTENNYSPAYDIESSTMNQDYDLKPDIDELIVNIKCARTLDESIDCDAVTRIQSLQERICTTLLHKGAIYYDSINRPHLFNKSAGKYEDYFDVKEVLRIVLDFEPEDYADLKRQIGARMIFHVSNYVPSMEESDVYITRGFRYDFTLEREDMRLLERPYGDCFDYNKPFLAKYGNQVNPRVPLFGSTCFLNCVTKNIIHSFKCWPPSMPYYRNDSLDPELKLRACNWIEERQFILASGESSASYDNDTFDESNSRIDMRSYLRVKRFCWTQCALHCHGSKSLFTVTKSKWPSEAKTLLDTSGNESLLNHCCALITVKNMRYNYKISRFIPKYNVPDTFSNIGGLLAVWLGISMVSVYHAIQKLVEICRDRSLDKLDFKIITKTGDG